MPGKTFFEAIKEYVGFDGTSTEFLRRFHPVAEGHFSRIVDDFYGAIQRHPGASAAITGGVAQIERLKQMLVSWMHDLLRGPHDEAYFEKRSRIGRVHVRIDLPQSYMLTAMNRIRLQLVEIARELLSGDPTQSAATARALHQILDLELAIMLETYREDLLAKNLTAERLSTIGEFAAGIGHELRNPLGVIESSVYLLRQHLTQSEVIDPRVGRHLDKINAEVQRSSKTITELLELARNRAPHRQDTSLRQIVASAIATAQLPPGVEVTTLTHPVSDITINADPEQIVRVLANLFINSGQAMGPPGRIVVEGTRTDGATTVRVRDDGPGVPADVRHRIFEALFTTKAKGTGLGLALCRRIVEGHGGTITLEPGEHGASFAIIVPDAAPLGDLS